MSYQCGKNYRWTDGQMAFQLHIVDYGSELKIFVSFQLQHIATEVGAGITNINVIYKLI